MKSVPKKLEIPAKTNDVKDRFTVIELPALKQEYAPLNK